MDDDLTKAVNKLIQSLDEKHADNKVVMQDIQRDVLRALSGFPQDDPEAHRRYHESVIEWRELRNKLVREALTKAIGAGTVAGAGWVAYALWQAFITTVRIKS